MKLINKHRLSVIFLGLSCLILTSVYMYNKRVIVIVDGVIEEHYTNAITYDFLATDLSNRYNIDDYQYDTVSGESIIGHNEILIFNSKKNIEVTVNNETKDIATYSATSEELVEELIEEDELEKSENIEYVPTSSALLSEVSELKIVKVETVREEEITTEKLAEETVDNPNLNKWSRKVISSGTPNEYRNVYDVVYYDGEVYSKDLVDKVLIKEGSAPVVEVGTKTIPTLPPNYADGSTVWDQISACEAGGNWSTNTGNGYYGGLQFSEPSWRTASNAVGVSAEYAHLASREEQIRAAEWMLSKSSWKQQWPSCSKKLGLW